MKLLKHKDRCNCSGKQIRLAREKLNYSQEQLAAQLQLIGLSMNQKAISRIETGIRVVPDYELLYFAQVLGVSILWLLGAED